MSSRSAASVDDVAMDERVILGVTRVHRVGDQLDRFYHLTADHRYDTHRTLCGLTTGIPTIALGEMQPCVICERKAE